LRNIKSGKLFNHTRSPIDDVVSSPLHASSLIPLIVITREKFVSGEDNPGHSIVKIENG
jgi:hypothetical protein